MSNIAVVNSCVCRGINLERSKNWLNIDYKVDLSFDEVGLRHYLHKYFDPQQQNNYKYICDENGKFIYSGKNSINLAKHIKETDNTYVLKLVAQIRDTNRLQLYYRDSTDPLIEYKDDYTELHTLVFENVLFQPNPALAGEEPYFDYISDHKILKDNWILVDIDHYLNGNPYFSGVTSLEKYKRLLALSLEKERNDWKVYGEEQNLDLNDFITKATKRQSYAADKKYKPNIIQENNKEMKMKVRRGARLFAPDKLIRDEKKLLRENKQAKLGHLNLADAFTLKERSTPITKYKDSVKIPTVKKRTKPKTRKKAVYTKGGGE